jgi:hypothetical protein
MVQFRSPRRISITVSHATYERLLERCDAEGRSLSNLAAYLLETSTDEAKSLIRKVVSTVA